MLPVSDIKQATKSPFHTKKNSFQTDQVRPAMFSYQSSWVLVNAFEHFKKLLRFSPQVKFFQGIHLFQFLKRKDPFGEKNYINNHNKNHQSSNRLIFADNQKEVNFIENGDQQHLQLIKIKKDGTIIKRWNLFKVHSLRELFLHYKNCDKTLGIFFEKIRFSCPSLIDIECAVTTHSYVKYCDFQNDLTRFINGQIHAFYHQFSSPNMQETVLEESMKIGRWKFLTERMFKIWWEFTNFSKKHQCAEQFETKFISDLQRLYSQARIFRINKPYQKPCDQENQTKTIQFHQPENQQRINEEITISDLTFRWQTNETVHLQRYPLPEEYNLLQDYKTVQQNQKGISMQRDIRKSNFHSAIHCGQLMLLNRSHYKLVERIECQNHSCLNSQIREKKGLSCIYLDQSKNLNDRNYHKSPSVRECHCYGLDLYTVRIIYYLLPLENRSQSISQNSRFDTETKQEIIKQLMQGKVQKSLNLHDTVKSLLFDNNWVKLSQYHQKQLHILHKKLSYVENLLQAYRQRYGKGWAQYTNLCQLFFHYKGLGIRNNSQVIPKGQFIEKFVGEVLNPWQEEERQRVALKISQQGYNGEPPSDIKFYCITVQSHIYQPGYITTFSIDPQNAGNFTRSLNHSCNPNCTTDVVVSEGQYHLGIYALRDIKPGQQLTFDYFSVTDDYSAYEKALCLCGSCNCTGRYLTYMEDIFLGFDQKFMKKKMSLKKRMRLIVKLSILSSKSKKQERYSLQEYIALFDAFRVKVQNIEFFFQKAEWFLKWILKILEFILEEEDFTKLIQSYKENTNSLSVASQGITMISPIIQGDFKSSQALRERLLCLTSKINKIANFLLKTKDLSPPIELPPKEQLLQKVKVLAKNQQTARTKNLPFLQSKYFSEISAKYRFELIQKAKNAFLSKKYDMIQTYIDNAFTFIQLKPHIYPVYNSSLVKIWREDAPQIEERVQYMPEELYVLNKMVFWGGQLKKYKQFRELPLMSQKEVIERLLSQASQSYQQKQFGLVKPSLSKSRKMSLETFSNLQKQMKVFLKAEERFWKQQRIFPKDYAKLNQIVQQV